MHAGTFAMRGSLLLSAIDLLDIVYMEAQAINVETSLFQALVSVLRVWCCALNRALNRALDSA